MSNGTITQAVTAKRSTRVYHGWIVVAAATVVALFGWGLGFYGPGVYLVALQESYGWTTGELSSAVTLYYLFAASLVLAGGRLFEKFGARPVVALGVIAMASGATLLAAVREVWQVYLAFMVMAIGWAAMSGAAINIIIAPWFDKRRGLAVSLALTGSGLGGIVLTPLLVALSTRYGLAAALHTLVAAMLVLLLPIVLIVLRPRRADEHDTADSAADTVMPDSSTSGKPSAAPWQLAPTLRSEPFLTISAPFAIGLMAQVGFLTHQVAFVSPLLGIDASAWAVGVTVLTAMLGRVVTGLFVGKIDARVVASGNFLAQALAMAAFLVAEGPASLYLACGLLGLSVGNMISLPGIVVQRDFPKEHFARAISLVIGINQFTFAFGPGLLGALRQAYGSYTPALLVCLAIHLVAAIVVVAPAIRSLARRP